MPVALTDPDPERGYPGSGLGLVAKREAMAVWHDTCCPHDGWAIMERLISTLIPGRRLRAIPSAAFGRCHA